MSKDWQYDFSRDSGLKPKLLEKLKTEYAKAAKREALCDDQLELVAAAGTPGAIALCPYSFPCAECLWFQGHCAKQMVKDEGGGKRV